MAKLPDYISRAIKSGPAPNIRQWRRIKNPEKLTLSEKIMLFAESFLHIPEGEHVGDNLKLAKFQEAFVYCVFDNPGVRTAIFSVARRNGKTFTIAVVAMAYLIGPLSLPNQVIASAAMSRDQAALIFRAMSQMIAMSEVLSKHLRVTPSTKRIVNISNGAEFYAMSADAKTGHGKSLKVVILDEAGQIRGETNEYVEMLATSQGSYASPLFVVISTQAPADIDYLSVLIDDATRSKDPSIVCHVYEADEALDLDDKEAWLQSNPGINDGFRSVADIQKQAAKAKRLPNAQAGFENLILNRRISMDSLWLAPAVWKANGDKPDWSVFRSNGVSVGLDLSQKNDLCCAVISAKDESDIIHVHPFSFTPRDGIDERSKRDRVPYDQWARDNQLVAVPGKTIDYDWMAQYLKINLLDAGIEINSIEFDRWRIAEFKAACSRNGVELMEDQWHEVGQGYQSMSPRIEAMETALLQEKIRHGSHPVLNLGASSAIAVQDPSNNRKLDKKKASNKIDAVVAMVQSVYPLITNTEFELGDDVSWLVG